MTLAQIGILAALAALLGRLTAGRTLALLATSTIVLFWLQPAEPIASLSFWLPVGTLLVAVSCWLITTAPSKRAWQQNWPAVAVMLGVTIALGLTPGLAQWLNPALTEPTLKWELAGALTIAVVAFALWRWKGPPAGLVIAAGALLLMVFVITKSPQMLSAALTTAAQLPFVVKMAADVPFAWLGYSYVAFRLLHTLRDHQTGKLPVLSLGEYVDYVIFFPSFTAGPIDRVERFVTDLRSPVTLANEDWVEAGKRLVMGLFKKLVLADLLAVLAFNDLLVQYVRRPGWMWVFLYAYALRIFLDFSGYTDIAIAMGRLLGIRLPENFAAPYLKQNITLFWNSWHMSLTQWFRAYVFNPLARRLRTVPAPLPEWVVLLLTQVVTMLLIGLWHGISWSFALWGLWHGLGLFVHSRWAGLVRSRWPTLTLSPAMSRLSSALGVLITFNFVSLGWLFFGLSTPELAWRAFRLLLGAT